MYAVPARYTSAENEAFAITDVRGIANDAPSPALNARAKSACFTEPAASS